MTLGRVHKHSCYVTELLLVLLSSSVQVHLLDKTVHVSVFVLINEQILAGSRFASFYLECCSVLPPSSGEGRCLHSEIKKHA